MWLTTAKICSGAFRGSESGSVEEDKELEAIFERTFGKSASGKGSGSDTDGRFGYERKKWSKKPKETVYDVGGAEYLKRHEKSTKSVNGLVLCFFNSLRTSNVYFL